MAKTKISEFNANPALNTDIDSINLAEGCAPSGINDAIRELMAQLKDWQSGTSNDPYVVGSSGSLTLNQGTANGVAYLNGSKVVTSGSALVFDGTNLGVGIASPNTLLDVRGANGIGIRFLETSTGNTNRVQLGTGSGYGYIDATAGVGSTALAFQVGSSEQMRLTSTGLGIGTSSPGRNLSVYGSSTAFVQVINATTGATATDGGYLSQQGADTLLVNQEASGSLILGTANTVRATLDTSGNLGLGVTPSAWSAYKAMQFAAQGVSVFGNTSISQAGIGSNGYYNGTNWIYNNSSTAAQYLIEGAAHKWYTAASGTAGNAITFTQAMTLDASGNLLVGTTSSIGSGPSMTLKCPTAGQQCYTSWNATTSGNAYFHEFGTEGTYTARGSITYNRAGGLTAYNTTSDYRAKDISGPVIGSGALIDSTPVYMGKMKGATQERPMFIAHETPSYAHTGVKDAVDEDGNPVYQQMDASALIPVMWAEIQSLRKRLADAGL